MKPTTGYYSLIQYCPDRSRLESANIGVLLFCPEIHFLQARTSELDSRARQFFGLTKGEQWKIEAMRTAIEERLKTEKEEFQTLEDLEHFIATRANAIQITPPRPMQVINPEEDLQQLFAELVKNPVQKETEIKVKEEALEPIDKVLAKTFADENLKRRLRRKVTVTVPAFRRQLTVPYGYQNGTFNLIQPVRFEGKRQTVEKEACVYAVEGQSIAKNPDPNLGAMQLVVVGQFPLEQREAQDMVRNLLAENEVRFYSADELDSLIKEILTTAKILNK